MSDDQHETAEMPSSKGSIPVILLSGFLGSGKTTLLNQLIQQPSMRRSLVIINEFGDTSLDHRLFVATEESIQEELSSGCICCSLRDDLTVTLTNALWRFSRQGQRQFDRVIIKSSGLADPAPVLHTLKRVSALAKHYHLGALVTLVDSINGLATLDTYETARRQVSMADVIVFTKSALLQDQDQQTALMERVTSLNPVAVTKTMDRDSLMAQDILAAGPPEKGADVSQAVHWLTPAHTPATTFQLDTNSPPDAVHDRDIQAFTLSFSQPVTAVRIQLWLTMIATFMGDQMLRFKGLIDISGSSRPMVIHGVQHIVHEPIELDDWPAGERVSRIVFITRGIHRSEMAASLEAALDISLPAMGQSRPEN